MAAKESQFTDFVDQTALNNLNTVSNENKNDYFKNIDET